MLGADSTVKVEIDYDNRILSAIYHKDLEMTFSTLNKDSVEIDMGENVMHVFRKLDISHKIKPTKERITRIIGQKCIDSVQGYKMDFTLEQYYRDKVLELPHRKNNLWNHNREDFGFWIVDKYLDNAFLMFSIGQTERKNIFQIISVSRNGIELEHLQEDGILNNLQVLNGCQ